MLGLQQSGARMGSQRLRCYDVRWQLVSLEWQGCRGDAALTGLANAGARQVCRSVFHRHGRTGLDNRGLCVGRFFVGAPLARFTTKWIIPMLRNFGKIVCVCECCLHSTLNLESPVKVMVVDSHAEFAATVAHIEDPDSLANLCFDFGLGLIQEMKCLNAIVCWGTFEPTVIKRPDTQLLLLQHVPATAQELLCCKLEVVMQTCFRRDGSECRVMSFKDGLRIVWCVERAKS